MSRRAFQKRQRELGQDILSTLSDLKNHEEGTRADEDGDTNLSDSDSGDDFVMHQPKPSLFDLLRADDNDEEEEDESSIEDEKKHQQEMNQINAKKTSPKTLRKQVKNNKGKKKNSRQKKEQDSDEEDIDQLIREIEKINPKEEVDHGAKSNPDFDNQKNRPDLLQIQPKFLDAEAEMRKIFGSRVINQGSRASISRAKKIGGRKLVLSNPTDTWPRFTRMNINMELIERKEDILYFKWVHSKSYQQIQCRFLDCIETHNPATIQSLLQMYPYHVDSVLQISEVLKHSGDIPMASQFIERALFVFERSFHSMFNLSSDKCRLSYLFQENRSFYIALFKHIEYVARKGCWRTAFEFCKLVYSLSPGEDPMGILTCFDFYAIRAEQYEWLQNAYYAWKDEKRLDVLPNWLYSLALSYKLQETEQNPETKKHSKKFIRMALSFFPNVALALLVKCGIQDPTMASHALLGMGPTSDGHRLLTNLYVERCHQLWKEHTGWLRQECLLFIQDYGKGINAMELVLNQGKVIRNKIKDETFPRQYLRHVHVSDLASVPAIMPSSFLESETVSMHDPWPPKNAPRSVYDEYLEKKKEEVSGINPFRDMGMITAFLSSVFPWMNTEGRQPAGNQGRGTELRHQANLQEAQEGLRETMEAARAAFPGMFPEGNIDVNNPQWMQRLANLVGDQLGWTNGSEEEMVQIDQEEDDHQDQNEH